MVLLIKMECPKINCNLMIYGAEDEWVYRTRTRFLVSSARPPTQESCLREIRRLKGGGGAHFQLFSVITDLCDLLSALCLPHAYLLCKPYFFSTLWISPQLQMNPNLPQPYLGPCPTTKIQSISSILLCRTPSPYSPL